MKLSVIIPVYNVEKYLRKCVTSVINQTYKNIEILLINDGSTDSSGEICDEFESKYDNVRSFHKKNEGLSETRNFGIKHSSAEYIAFLDSDDFIFPNAYEKMMNEIINSDVDIVIGKLVKYIPNKDIYVSKQISDYSKCNTIVSGKVYLNDTIKEKAYTAVSVKGIYKKSLINENDLFFQKDLLHEDELWTPKILLIAQKVIDIDEVFYAHVFREGSITNQKNKQKNAIDLIKIVYELESFYKNALPINESKYLRDYLVTLYLNALNIGGFLEKNSELSIDKEFLLKNTYSIKNYLKSLLVISNKTIYRYINNYHKSIL